MNHVISIDPDGTVRTLYTEKIDLRDFGPLYVERASNVEWHNARDGWTVQFADGTYMVNPLGIPRLFDAREDALAAEVDFLQARL
jgi:hypothetical protein